MLEQMKVMGALAGLLKDKDRIAQKGEEFKRKLEGMSVTGAAGGGAVRVTVTGKMRVTHVELDPNVVAGMAADPAAVESLIAEATNDALERVQRLVAEQARLMAEELGLPSELGDMTKLLGA